MFGLYYVSVILYPNNLKLAFKDSFFTFYGWEFLLIHLISIYLFLVAGRNPGYVDETETPQSRKEKARVFVGQYDEFRTMDDESKGSSYAQVENETNVST